MPNKNKYLKLGSKNVILIHYKNCVPSLILIVNNRKIEKL